MVENTVCCSVTNNVQSEEQFPMVKVCVR